MGKLKVTITHGSDNSAVYIAIGLGFMVLLAAFAVPTAGTISAGAVFLSELITWVTVAVALGVAGLCAFYGWKRYKNLPGPNETATQDEWTDYCRRANEKALEARITGEPQPLEPLRVESTRQVEQSVNQSPQISQ